MERALKEIAEAINEKLEKYWLLQGHAMQPSKFIDSLDYEIDKDRLTITGLTDAEYSKFVRSGVSAEKIPFTPGSGKRKSLYIEGLTNYVIRRMGLPPEEALSVAFAIAYTHKKEGMPTINSRDYSQTGKRTNFIDHAFEEVEKEKLIENILDEAVEEMFDRSLEIKL